MKKRTRWIMWGVIALVGVAVLAGIASALSGPKVKVKTATVEDTGLERRVSASGVTASRADVDVFSPLTGTVKRVYVTDQAQVRMGEQIIQIEPAPYRVGVAQAYAAYLAAKAQSHGVSKGEPTGEDYAAARAAADAAYRAYWVAQREFEEMEPEVVVGPSGTTTVPASYRQLRIQVAQTEAAYKQSLATLARLGVQDDTGPDHAAASSNVEQAYLAYVKAKDDLGKTCVRAPIAGTVFLDSFAGTAAQGPARTLAKHQAVAPQTPLCRIIDARRMKFVADVDEADIAQVKNAQKARITLDAFEDRTLWGTVVKVSILSKTTASGGSAFAADLVLPASVKGIRVGMNGTADIIITRRESALQVPIEAVTEREGADVVFVIENGTAKLTDVTLGFSTDTVYEVNEGLEGGETVAISGLDDLKDGMKVGEE